MAPANDPGGSNGGSPKAEPPDDDTPLPFDGVVLLRAGALASLAPARLPDLLRRVQRDLGPRRDQYRRRYERVHGDAERELFLVDAEHWGDIADRVGLDDRESDAVVRAHEAQLERIGSATDRREEFDSALEIRSAVVIGVGDCRARS